MLNIKNSNKGQHNDEKVKSIKKLNNFIEKSMIEEKLQKIIHNF